MPPYERGNVPFVGRDLRVPPLPTDGFEERHRWLRTVTILFVGADAYPKGTGSTFRSFFAVCRWRYPKGTCSGSRSYLAGRHWRPAARDTAASIRIVRFSETESEADMKKVLAYLKAHRREQANGTKLALASISALTAAAWFLQFSRDAFNAVLGVAWCVLTLTYLYQAFFVTPGDKQIDYAAESAQAEADLTAALAACDDDALRKIIYDPLRGEAIKARAKALLAERE